MRIVILDGYTLSQGREVWGSIASQGTLTVHDRTSADQIVDRLRDADVALTNKVQLRQETLERLPGLKYVAVMAGAWSSSPDWCFWRHPLVELSGLKMGIVGFGRIGRKVGEIAHAFGMEVLAASRSRTSTVPTDRFAWASIPEIFEKADVVSLHCPETAETKGFVTSALLGRMKKTAFLLNTSRGSLIDEKSLAAALEEGVLAGAALDVVSQEPI